MQAIFKYNEKLDGLSKKELAEKFAITFQLSFNSLSLKQIPKPVTKLVTFQEYKSNKENWYNMCKELLKTIAEYNKLTYVLAAFENMDITTLDEDLTIEFLTYINEACVEMCEEAMSSNISSLLTSEDIDNCDEYLQIIIKMMKKLNTLDDSLFNPKNMNLSLIKDIVPSEISSSKMFSYKRFFIDIFLTCAISGDELDEEILANIFNQVADNYLKSSNRLKQIVSEFIKEAVN